MDGNRVWHLEHFKCSECKQQIGDSGFHEKDDKIYCLECYQNLFLPVCPVCKTHVHGVVMNGKFHQKCFKCTVSSNKKYLIHALFQRFSILFRPIKLPINYDIIQFVSSKKYLLSEIFLI